MNEVESNTNISANLQLDLIKMEHEGPKISLSFTEVIINLTKERNSDFK